MDETRNDEWRGAPPGYAHALPPVAATVPAEQFYGPMASLARPPSALGGLTAALLAAQALLAFASALVAGWTVLTYAALSGGTLDTLLAPDRATLGLLLATSAMSVVTGLVFVTWLFLACRNVVLYGVRSRRSPGWAIGAWFIPVVNLWWPKQVVDDALRGSRANVPAGTDVSRLPRSGVVTAWWVCWLLAGVLSGAAAASAMVRGVRLELAAPTSDFATVLDGLDVARLRETQAMWSIWSATASCLAACLAVVIVLEVTRSQKQRRAALSESG